MLKNKIERAISRYTETWGNDPRFVVMDAESYFELKQEEFGDIEIALTMELTEVLGLAVFYNHLGYNYIDVA